MATDMNSLLANLSPNAPASMTAVEEVERQLGVKLPHEYVKFVTRTNGGEGFIGQDAYVILWAIGDLASMNQAYEVQKHASGLLIFGSDGGGEAFGFDTRNPGWPVVQVPFVGMTWDLAQSMGATFNEFLERLYEIKDDKLLNAMREVIIAYRSSTINVGELADQLLPLRDRLQLRDHSWAHELTQQIATLDSASTFTPKDNEQANQLSHVIEAAINTIVRLIEDKLT